MSFIAVAFCAIRHEIFVTRIDKNNGGSILKNISLTAQIHRSVRLFVQTGGMDECR